jgi:hypothetical protein
MARHYFEIGACHSRDRTRSPTGRSERTAFQRKDRSWTDQDFPDSKAVQEPIEAKLKSIGLNDPALKEAFDTLRAMD